MGNLISLCEDCHERLHNIVADTSKGHIRKKNSYSKDSILRGIKIIIFYQYKCGIY